MDLDLSKVKLSGNRFGLISDLREIMRPKQLGPGAWWRISTVGEFEICHYDAGLVCLVFYSSANYYKNAEVMKYSPRLSMTTLDDGGWFADGQEMEYEDCIKFVDKNAKILDDLTVLPSEKEFNKLLQPLGMYGVYG